MEKLKYKIRVYAATAHNRTVYAAPPVGGLASIRLGQSLRSFPRLIPAKPRKQPERYMTCRLKFIKKL
jgi:hypothetical protein